MAQAPRITIVSDGRGETATRLVNSALVQFGGRAVTIELAANVRSVDEIEAIVARAAADQSVIFYTLVSPETRNAIHRVAREHLVPVVDLLGSTLSALHDLLKSEPSSRPGLLYESDREHFDRMDAIDYTLKHDDGQHPENLSFAHVVLVGVSRASKSSTSFYLGYHGIRAANVPLIPGIAPPQQLIELDSLKVIGLTINRIRLQTVREARARHLHDSVSEYLEKTAIAREIRWANDLMEQHGWRTVDVSYMAIEEIAREVLEMRGLPLRIPR